ncbi:baseplate J/gp47 family protein [Alloalcanivorax xenomutans]
MAQITDQGVTGTTLAEYLERLREAYLAIDPDWNINPESPDGQKMAIDAELLADLDEQVQMSYLSNDPRSATGDALDRIADYAGIQRQAATPSTATVVFSGVTGTVVPAGTTVRNTSTATLWATDHAVTLVAGSASVGVTCTTPGAEGASIGALSALGSSVGGITSVTNPAPAILGRDQESDVQFRARRRLSVAKPGDNQVDSIYAQIADVPGVSRLRIYENYESTTDTDGILPHSICIFVQGGADEDIGSAIAAGKNPGCGLNATNTFPNKVQLEAMTPRGNPLAVTFYRPEVITAYLEVALSPGTPEGLIPDIKQSIIDYANATLFSASAEGFDNTGFQIGEVVPVGKLYTPVNRVVADQGYVESILIGSGPSDVTHQSLDPGTNGIVVFDAENITVEVSP